MAARAKSAAEKAVYATIADGWKKLATEAARNEARADQRPSEPRSFGPRARNRGGDD